MQKTTTTRRGTGTGAIVLLLGDWLALALFVFLGQVDHDVVDVGRWLMQTAVFAAPWTVVALILDVYHLPDGGALRAFLGRSLLAWLVAAPPGLILRAVVQGQTTIVVAFMLVTMGVGGLFLLGWRLLYFLVQARRARP